MELGERIKNRRIELGMTQQELAKKIGLADRSSIAKIETGDRPIRVEQLAEVASALKIDVQELVGGFDLMEIDYIYKKLSAEKQNQLLDFARYLLESDK